MFHAARVKSNLHVTVGIKATVITVVATLATLVFGLWLFWVVALKNELFRIRVEIYAAVSKSIGDVINDAFERNHASLLNLESCQTELKQTQAINKDLSKMVSKISPK